jgi:hypothetical protein
MKLTSLLRLLPKLKMVGLEFHSPIRLQSGVLKQLTPWRAFFFIFYLVCEAVGTAANPGLLCQSRVIVKIIVEKQMECKLAGETEVLGENLPPRHFCASQNPI